MTTKQGTSFLHRNRQRLITPTGAAVDPASNPAMTDAQSMHLQGQNWGPQVCEALNLLEGSIMDGLRHGFFEISITCQIVSGGKREVVVHAGKSYKFTIPENELPH